MQISADGYVGRSATARTGGFGTADRCPWDNALKGTDIAGISKRFVDRKITGKVVLHVD
jgi:hypothetical protein